jgi:hypothetical protein
MYLLNFGSVGGKLYTKVILIFAPVYKVSSTK